MAIVATRSAPTGCGLVEIVERSCDPVLGVYGERTWRTVSVFANRAGVSEGNAGIVHGLVEPEAGGEIAGGAEAPDDVDEDE